MLLSASDLLMLCLPSHQLRIQAVQSLMLVVAAIPVESTLNLDPCVSKTCPIGATSAQVELQVVFLIVNPPKDSQARQINTKVGTDTFNLTSSRTIWILQKDRAKFRLRDGSRTTQTTKITKVKTRSWCSNLTALKILSSRPSIKDTLKTTKRASIQKMAKNSTQAASWNCQKMQEYIQATWGLINRVQLWSMKNPIQESKMWQTHSRRPRLTLPPLALQFALFVLDSF